MIKTIDPILDKRWDTFISSHPESIIFHHSAWTKVLSDIYPSNFTYYVIENDNHEISAAAPFYWIKSPITGNRLVSLPQCEYCFPLVRDENELKQLIDKVIEDVEEKRNAYLEIRGWGKTGSPAQYNLKEYPYFLTHTIDIGRDLQEIQKRMNRNGRYNLRYAEKTPVVIKVGQDEKDLKKIYQLSTITRRRINLLPQPYNLYRSIYNNIIVPGHGYMLLAELNGKIIAANVYFCFNHMVLHEFAVQDSDYMEYRPNYLLIWKAIERAKNEGYLYYNFGRTQPENQSLIQFKKNWGSNEAVLPYYYYPDIRGLSTISKSSRIYQTYNTMNKCLPPFLLKVVCEFMQKHMN